MKINKKIIEELVKYLKEFNLSEIEYGEGSTKVKVSRSTKSQGTISTEIKNYMRSISFSGKIVDILSENDF